MCVNVTQWWAVFWVKSLKEAVIRRSGWEERGEEGKVVVGD